MNRFLQILVGLPAALFILMGLRWLFDPGGVAPDFGFTLETGKGLSSQVGDLAGFFLTLGVCMVMALVTRERTWYYPAVMLLLFAALGRTLAWAIHDAALAPEIILEVVVAGILLFASTRLPAKDVEV